MAVKKILLNSSVSIIDLYLVYSLIIFVSNLLANSLRFDYITICTNIFWSDKMSFKYDIEENVICNLRKNL